jgi:hypothetical protein
MNKRWIVLSICIIILGNFYFSEALAKDPTRWDIPVDEATICPEHNVAAVPYGKIAGGNAWFHIVHPTLPESLTKKIPLEEIKKMLPQPSESIMNKLIKDIKKKNVNKTAVYKLIDKIYPGPTQKQFEEIMNKLRAKKAAGESFNENLLTARSPKDLATQGYPVNLVIIKFWLEDLEEYAKSKIIERKQKEGEKFFTLRDLQRQMKLYAWLKMRAYMQCLIRAASSKKNRSINQPVMSKIMPSKFAVCEQKVGARLGRPLSSKESGLLRGYMRAQIQQKIRKEISKINMPIMMSRMHAFVGPLTIRIERGGGVREYLMEKYRYPNKEFKVPASSPGGHATEGASPSRGRHGH